MTNTKMVHVYHICNNDVFMYVVQQNSSGERKAFAKSLKTGQF